MTATTSVDGRSVSCAGKVRFLTRKDARKARNNTRGAGVLHIYRCSFCGLFHLGHLPQDIVRGRRDKASWKRRRGI